MSPKVTVSMLLLVVCISLRENTGSKRHSCFRHFHVPFSFQNWQTWLTKTAQSCLAHHKIPSHLGCHLQAGESNTHWKLTAGFHLETHCWIPPKGRTPLSKRICGKTRWDCATSDLFFLLESPCPAVCCAGQENNLFWPRRAPAWQGQRGQAHGEKWA